VSWKSVFLSSDWLVEGWEVYEGELLIVTEDFALSEASYAIIRILIAFPKMKLPPEIEKEKTGQERQNLTIVVSSAEGCKVLLR
jgi:hypothetical protein